VSSRERVSVAAGDPTRSLDADAVGVPGIVFIVVAAAAPLTAMVGGAGIVLAIGNGVGIPGAFAIAAASLAIFAVGFVAMSRHVRNAGAFYAYISQGLGRPAGVGAAFIAVLAYNVLSIGIAGLFGYFASTVFDDLFGLSLPWDVWSFSAIVTGFVVGYRGIKVSAEALGVLLIAEILILVVLSVGVIIAGGDSGLSLQPLAPNNIFSGAVGVALMFGFTSFIGFEGAAIYTEEARDFRRTVPRATYVSVAILGVGYAFLTWIIVNAFGTSKVVPAATADPGALFFLATDRYVGGFAEDVMQFLIVTSSFAALFALHNAANRYLFVLGRERLGPPGLGRTHATYRSPWVAGLVQAALIALVVGGFAIAGADPYLELFAWLVGAGSIALLLLLGLVGIAVIVFFRAHSELDSRAWNTVIAPAIGAASIFGILVLALKDFELLTGAGTGVNLVLLAPIPVVGLAGIAVALYTRSHAPERYERLATVRLAEEPSHERVEVPTP
jgi:amino acid transporter